MNQEMIGKTIAGRYRILEVIGSGGFGTVYKALDARFQEVVALKMLSHHFAHDAEFKRRFQREALVMASLNHPNIVRVSDYGEADGLSYLVIEYIEGPSLAWILAEGKPLAVDYAIEIIRQVGEALSYAHSRGIIHRDLKPSNILISKDGRVLLSDLGLAIAPRAPTTTDIGTIMGTPGYMSPEQAMGKPVDARSDIYSLGLILYQLLTGRLPFSTDSPGSMLYAHVHESPPPLRWFNPAVPPLVEQAVLKALAKDPKQRYQTVDEFVAALSLSVSAPARAMIPAPALTERYSPSQPPYAAARPSAKVGRAWQLTWVLVGFLGTVALVAVFGPTLGNWVQSQPLLALLATLATVIVVSVALIVRRSSHRVRAEVLAAPPPPPTAVVPPMPAQPRRADSQPITGETIPYAEPPVAGTILLRHEPSATAWLLVLNGPHRGRHFPLSDSVTIGRGENCDVVLDDPTASRQHARMRLENSRFYIYDLASVNGTFVNGVHVKKQELRDRDDIRIGNTIMLFVQAVSPQDLTVEAKRRLRKFESIWDQLTGPRAMDQGQFEALTKRLVNGLLREAIGYSVEDRIPYYKGIVGYMVQVPMLWIRHSRFPILFVAYDRRQPDVLADVVKQLEMAKATEYFALLIVVPTREGTGNEAEELRRIVANSVYRHDFVVLDRQHLAGIIAQSSSQRLIEIILEQGIELSSLSPYIVKGPVSERMFFGREKEIKAISQTIQSGNYAVVGGRRIGKSSILLKVTQLLDNDPRYQAVYLNCEEKSDYADLFQVLSNEFGEPLSRSDPLTFRKLATTIKEKASPRQVVFLLDEIDELLAFDAQFKPAGQLFKTFRALSHEGVCRFVFSGSRTLYRHLHDPQSPFFNFCEDIILRPLEEKSVAEIVSKPMHQLGIELPEEETLIDRIIDLTSCHPNLVQWLCDKLVKTISVPRITLDDLETVSADSEFHRHFVETAWGDASPLEKLISLLMEGSPFEPDQLFEALAYYGITAKTMIRESLEMLQVYALIDREGQRYRFGLSHFPRIVRAFEDVPSLIERLLTQVEA